VSEVPAPVDVHDLLAQGPVDYTEALMLQHTLVDLRTKDAIADQLLLLEHRPVITVGRGADAEAAGAAPFPVVEIERGGEATFHGPGQLVGYPILRLADDERDLHRYLRNLEEVLMLALADLGLEAERNPPHTGVWSAGRKLASIGVAVRRWVTYHGFALNVATDLAAFRAFKPCGLEPSVMASITDLCPETATGGRKMVETVDAVVARFGEVLDREVIRREPGALEEMTRHARHARQAASP